MKKYKLGMVCPYGLDDDHKKGDVSGIITIIEDCTDSGAAYRTYSYSCNSRCNDFKEKIGAVLNNDDPLEDDYERFKKVMQKDFEILFLHAIDFSDLTREKYVLSLVRLYADIYEDKWELERDGKTKEG